MSRQLCNLLLAFSLATVNVWAGQERIQITEGTSFRVGFIHPHPVLHERPLDDANLLILTSRIGATVTIDDARDVTIPPGGIVRVPVDSADVVSLHADRPFAVATFQAWLNNGEMAWQLPVSMWDIEYRPFAWWQDGFGLAGQAYTYATAKILVIAAHPNTSVTASFAAFTRDTVLQPGGSWLIDLPVDTAATRTAASDPTGMRISATLPVGVVSGHAKAGVLRYPDAMPATGPYARTGNFMRSNLHDAMLPTSMAGTRFVTAPLLYAPTRVRGTDQTRIGVEDDRGDVIRFIGCSDGTIIRRNGDSVATIDAGGTWMATSCQEATVWSTSAPALCAQYGKSYARITSQAGAPEDDPSTDAGLPLLQIVPSEDRWVTSATFDAPPDFMNGLNVVCHLDAVASLLFDGRPIAQRFSPRQIAASPYVALTGFVSVGSHTIASSAASGRFMAWTYGSLDGLLPSRIYGTVASVDLAVDCADSIVTTMVTTQDSVVITYDVIDTEDARCASVAMAYAARNDGGVITHDGNVMTITRATPTTMVDGEVTIVARSGRSATIPFHLDGTTSRGLDEIEAASFDVTVHESFARVTLGNAATSDIVRVVSVTGAIVRTVSRQGRTSIDIDLGGLAAGVYIFASGNDVRPVFVW